MKIIKLWISSAWLLLLPLFLAGQNNIIANETFEYPDGPLPENWWSEGCTAVIRDGHLFVDADTTSPRMSTVWLDREFGGDFTVEYDVHVVSSEGKKNNVNCFLLYSCPDGNSLRETRNEREDGLYSRYHQLNGYIFTYLANGNEDTARFRFRYNPGFLLVEENFGYHCRSGRTYHVKIIKVKNQLQFWMDGNKMMDNTIGNVYLHERGLFGFRTWHTALWWDNLLITQLE